MLNINRDGVAGGGWALSREGEGLVRWRGGVRKLADLTRTVDFATIAEVARGEIGMRHLAMVKHITKGRIRNMADRCRAMKEVGLFCSAALLSVKRDTR